jgi:hypothetical protein
MSFRAVRARLPRSTAVLAAALLTSVALSLVPATAHAKGPEIYPLSKVKRGQKGYGLTVFQGTDPERFDFEVIGVVKNFLPRQDIVLVKSDDPKLQVSGFAQGMSGSPLYLDGKVMCAFSYGFRFNKVAMGGCTPLETMVEESKTPLRGQKSTALASNEEWQHYQPLPRYQAARTELARADAPRDAWILQAPLPPVPPAPTQTGKDSLERAGVPLSVAGLGPAGVEQARKIFAPYGIEPMQAGGAGDDASGPNRFEMGGSIAVVLVKGDVAATAIGTVSYVDGDNVLAFGHPMFQMGESYMPVSGAEIHYVIPSSQSAFKMGTASRVLGTLTQDRQAMIQADTSRKVDMIPVDVNVHGPFGDKKFHTEVLRNRFLTPQMVMMTVVNGAQLIFPDVTDSIVTVGSTLYLRGYKPLEFTDYAYAPDGAGNAVASARALRVLAPLLFNPWTPVTIDRIELSVAVDYKSEYANLVDMRVPSTTVPTGKPFDVELTVQPFGGKPYVERIPMTLPARLAGQIVKIDVVPGDMARLDIATPENVDQLVGALRKTYPGNVLVATVYTADDGVSVAGKIVPNLPDSAIDTARPGASAKGADPYKSMLRVAVPMKRVIQGRLEMTVQVDSKEP